MADNMQLTIGHLYPDLLNLYGDRGNTITLQKRCAWRGITAKQLSMNWRYLANVVPLSMRSPP